MRHLEPTADFTNTMYTKYELGFADYMDFLGKEIELAISKRSSKFEFIPEYQKYCVAPGIWDGWSEEKRRERFNKVLNKVKRDACQDETTVKATHRTFETKNVSKIYRKPNQVPFAFLHLSVSFFLLFSLFFAFDYTMQLNCQEIGV